MSSDSSHELWMGAVGEGPEKQMEWVMLRLGLWKKEERSEGKEEEGFGTGKEGLKLNEMRLVFEEKEEEEEEGNGDTIPRANNGGALYLMSMEPEDDESVAFFVLSPFYFNVWALHCK